MSDPPHVDGVRHRYIGANGIVFHIAEAGPADGDPVLLLHGWPQHWYEWRHLIPALAADHRVLALDLRGFGWSDAPPRGYEKEQLADDVLAVLDALGLERVKLVGHDWGGWIGFLLCLRAPERFSCYLALNIVHPWQTVGGGWRQLPRFWYQQLIIFPLLGYLLHRGRAFVRGALRAGTTDQDAWDRPTLDAFADNLAQPARARACVQVYRTFALRELLPVIRGRYLGRRLTVPTHVVFGTDDPAIGVDLLAGYEPHADSMTVELVREASHFIADERPDLIAARARELFAER